MKQIHTRMKLKQTNGSGLTHLWQIVAFVVLIVILMISISKNKTRIDVMEGKFEAFGQKVDKLIEADNLDHRKLGAKMDTIIYNQNIE